MKDLFIEHEKANIEITVLDDSKHRINVRAKTDDYYIANNECVTDYPIDLIKGILDIKGPDYLCDEIFREQQPQYIQKPLKYDLLSYIPKECFTKKRILDFGCGAGASTVALAQMFPDSEIVGIELESDFLNIARQRAEFYDLQNVTFIVSPSSMDLPNIERFDFICLNAVYEHLLPDERKYLLPLLWDHLNDEGVLFLRETPFRYWHTEGHTTGGLPFLNYLPDRLAHLYTRKTKRRNLENKSWKALLRAGIRGGNVGEILKILSQNKCQNKLLKPSMLECSDRVDLEYLKLSNRSWKTNTKYRLQKMIKATIGYEYVPQLAIAIQKQ